MTRFRLKEVTWADPEAVALREAMEAEMHERYADRVAGFPASAREALTVREDQVAHVALAYDLESAGRAVGHAILRWIGGDLELKRMYVAPSHRGSGIARVILDGMADAARLLGATRIVLQTGDRQPDAVRLYEREGYARIPILPAYAALTFSICMEKRL